MYIYLHTKTAFMMETSLCGGYFGTVYHYHYLGFLIQACVGLILISSMKMYIYTPWCQELDLKYSSKSNPLRK